MSKLACLILMALVVGACGDDNTSDTADNQQTSTQRTDVDPEVFTIHVVEGEAAPPCEEVPPGSGGVVVGDDNDGGGASCLILGPAAVDARAVESAEIQAPGSGKTFSVFIQLDDDGTRALNELARDQFATAGKVALLYRGRLVIAPTIQTPEFDGGVGAPGLTRDEAVDLVRSVGGDPTVPDPDPKRADLERARAICESFLPQVGEGASIGIVSANTAGELTELQELFGQVPIEPWRSLTADHFVASCSYIWDLAGLPPTTVCPNGDVVTLTQPLQFFVDEDGRSSQDRLADTAGFSPAPCP